MAQLAQMLCPGQQMERIGLALKLWTALILHHLESPLKTGTCVAFLPSRMQNPHNPVSDSFCNSEHQQGRAHLSSRRCKQLYTRHTEGKQLPPPPTWTEIKIPE